jgi:Domain of unknown function (DUF1844)
MPEVKGEGFTIEPPSLTLSAFVLGLASSAFIHLGEQPNPETQTILVDLNSAKQSIDILELLAVKTVGNLTGEESHLLQTVLRDLRLKYVAKKSR